MGLENVTDEFRFECVVALSKVGDILSLEVETFHECCVVENDFAHSQLNGLEVSLHLLIAQVSVDCCRKAQALEAEQVQLVQELLFHRCLGSARVEMVEFKEHALLVYLATRLFFLFIEEFSEAFCVANFFFFERNESYNRQNKEHENDKSGKAGEQETLVHADESACKDNKNSNDNRNSNEDAEVQFPRHVDFSNSVNFIDVFGHAVFAFCNISLKIVAHISDLL